MIKSQNILKIALVLSAFFLVSYESTGQSILELLPGSEKLGYDKKTGAHRLVGSVNFRYQGNTMYCDSAHYFDKTQEVRAYGNVHVTKDDINLFCDSLYYNGKTKKAKLWGHVRVRDLEYKILTDTLEYDARKAVGIYRHGGRIESITSNEVLTSRVGYIYPESKNFFFSGKVNYKNDSITMKTDTLQYSYNKQTTYFFGKTDILRGKTKMHCEKGWYNVQTGDGSLVQNAEIEDESKFIKGDTLIYLPTQGKSIGMGHVYFRDTTDDIEFYGDYALQNEKKHFSYLTGHALAKKIQKNDTIYIHADTLFNQNDTLGKTLYSRGHNNVKIFSQDMQAISDSLIYDKRNNRMELYNSPIVWARNAELKADSMTIFFHDSILESIYLRENATALMELDSGLYYNQVSGKEMTSIFKDNKLVQTNVDGNAQTLFYPEQEEKTDSTVLIKRMGLNRLFASSLKIYLDSGEVTGITYYDKPDGVFYPMDQIKEEEQFLPNFKWNPLLRPKDPIEMIHD